MDTLLRYLMALDSFQKCDRSTALHSACTQGAAEAVKVMLSACQNIPKVINIIDGSGQTPLHKYTLSSHCILVYTFHEKRFLFFFMCGSNVCLFQGSHLWSPWAGRISHLKGECSTTAVVCLSVCHVKQTQPLASGLVPFLLQGADINCTDFKGHSPLLLATSCGAWQTVNLLLSRGN